MIAIGTKVIIKADKAIDNIGGIIVAARAANTGAIHDIACPSPCSKGNKVLFNINNALELEDGFIVVSEKNIEAIIK